MSYKLQSYGQYSQLSRKDLSTMLKVLDNFGSQSVEIDWTNRTIRILTAVQTDPTKILSDGQPLYYQDIIAEWS